MRAIRDLGVLVVVAGFGMGVSWAQMANEITEVSPDSAAQGTVGVVVAFALDTDFPPAPPAGVLPESVTIGGMDGYGVTHDTQYSMTATFDVTFAEAPGEKDVAITFLTPEGHTLVFSMAGGFTVEAGPDMAPVIVADPVSRTSPPGGSATFVVEAYGTDPLSYRWEKDGESIGGATASSYTISPVDWDDAGAYRCVVSNDFGTATSAEVTLTVASLPTALYTIVDTGQAQCYDAQTAIDGPAYGEPFYGQDAQIAGNQPSYAVSADGLTVFDNVTGLTWTRSPDLNGDGVIDVADKLTFEEALVYADEVLNPQQFGGYEDWRLPDMKTLYSLMDFRGTDPMMDDIPEDLTPFIDTEYFEFGYGDEDAGERVIDAQFWSTNAYLGYVFGNQEATFGLNLADGRIKGYPTSGPVVKLNYVYFVRGNTDYGVNNFVDNGDGTISDLATGLMWSKDDCGTDGDNGPRSGMNWEEALGWVVQMNADEYLGYDDWRLPNAKEMQSILDYSRAPDVTNSAAIDPIFHITQIVNEAGEVDYPCFWTGTTHVRSDGSGSAGAYVCFGRAMGYMQNAWMDVHGAGAQRSDPKGGDFGQYEYVSDGYYLFGSPQGDAIRMYNYVRLVRDAEAFVTGDLNCDGVVNNFDIDAFVLALTDPAAYAAQYPECDAGLGDVNGDGVVNNFDIDPFVALLTD